MTNEEKKAVLATARAALKREGAAVSTSDTQYPEPLRTEVARRMQELERCVTNPVRGPSRK
jgi:hypothetical protein